MLALLRLLIIPHRKLFWLILALLIWITAWFSFLSQSLQSITGYLDIQTKESLGGDLVIQGARPLRDEQQNEIDALLGSALNGNDFKHSATVRFFNSLSVGTGQPLLTTIVGYDDSYPLFGKLETTRQAQEGVYISDSLASQLLSVSQSLQIGSAVFPIAGTIVTMPGLGLNTFDGGRIVLMPIAQIQSTQLIQTGSRVSYRHAYALTAPVGEKTLATIESIAPEQEISTLVSERSQREQFFSQLSSVVLLALCSLIVLTYSGLRILNDMLLRRLLETLRLLRILGTTRKRLVIASSLLLLVLLALAFLLGGSLGYQAWRWLPWQDFGFTPVWQWGVFRKSCIVTTGIMAALAISRGALFRSDNVLSSSLYQEASKKQQRQSRGLIAGVLFFALLSELGRTRTSLGLALGIVGILVLLYWMVVLVLHAVAYSTQQRKKSSPAWWWVLRRSSQPGSPMPLMMTIMTSIFTVCALCFLFWHSIGAFIDDFQQSGQANTFILNIRDEDLPVLTTLFPEARPYDVILGRISSIDGSTLSEVIARKQLRAGSYTREFNMTTVMQDDTVVGGKAQGSDLSVGEVSVDSRVAEALDIGVGSELVMTIVGREFTLRVVQLRRTTRNAIKPFFFFQLAAEQFVDAPRSYFSVHRFDTIKRPSILKTMSERVGPHLSFIEVDGIIAQVEELLQAVAWSILLVFSSVVICGAVLLFLCFLTLTQEHDRDMKLLQMFGIRSDFLHSSRVAVTLYPLLFSLLCSIVVVVVVRICLRVLQDALPFSLMSIGLTVALLLIVSCALAILLWILQKKKYSL